MLLFAVSYNLHEVLVLGTDSPGGIVLAVPEKPEAVNNGDKLY